MALRTCDVWRVVTYICMFAVASLLNELRVVVPPQFQYCHGNSKYFRLWQFSYYTQYYTSQPEMAVA